MKRHTILCLAAFAAISFVGGASIALGDDEAPTWKADPSYDSRAPKHATGLVLPPNWKKATTVQKPQLKAGQSLPATFDWREKLELAPIEDQGQCGSCWAFSVTATVQDAIRVQGGQKFDASEQACLSCSGAGSCNGGYFNAFDYYVNPGAVPETEFPYAARDLKCKAGLSHPYKIKGWHWVSGEDIPSVDDIKTAIMTYGPVSVAVAADNAFSSYSSGVFNTCKSGVGGINHMVNLVGWGDGFWIMRNSWSPAWGDKGWMKIKFSCNAIGYGASYVIVDGVDPQPTPTPGPSPTPNPTPTPCEPKPRADAGPDVIRKIFGGRVAIGTPGMPGHTYEWKSQSGIVIGSSAMIEVGPWFDATYTVKATTVCGSAEDSVSVDARLW